MEFMRSVFLFFFVIARLFFLFRAVPVPISVTVSIPVSISISVTVSRSRLVYIVEYNTYVSELAHGVKILNSLQEILRSKVLTNDKQRMIGEWSENKGIGDNAQGGRVNNSIVITLSRFVNKVSHALGHEQF